jgi:hypothetical protein
MQEEKQTKRKSAVGLAWFGVGFLVSLAVGWLLFPFVLYGSVDQPMNFNHRIHVENSSCSDCHAFRPDGTFTGVPGLKKCMSCHSEAQGESESEKTFMRYWVPRYKKNPDLCLGWRKYYKQQPCVYFPHIAHVTIKDDGGYDATQCKVCHGDHGQSARLPVYQFNRLTRVSRKVWGEWIGGGFPFMPLDPNRRMKMMTCQKCHTQGYKLTDRKGKVLVQYKPRRHDTHACFPCHK